MYFYSAVKKLVKEFLVSGIGTQKNILEILKFYK